jgi:hypothetical protein
MALPNIEEPATGGVDSAADVQIATAPEGGWDVSVTVNGRTIASCRCNDWHRTERVKRCFEFAVKTYLSRITRTAAALVMMTAAAGVPAVARAQEAPDGVFSEPRVIGRPIDFSNRLAKSGDGGEVKNGFYPELSNMITGAGWISGGPGYRQWLAGNQVFVDGSAAVSWRARLTMPPPDAPPASLWQEPTDLEDRDLYYGPWGREHAPDANDRYTLVQLKHRGVNPGLTVRDSEDREWSVKQPFGEGPDEGPVEAVLSVTPDDARWAGELLARLSDRQWRDAFRAGGYSQETTERFVRVLRRRIDEARRVGSPAAAGDQQ